MLADTADPDSRAAQTTLILTVAAEAEKARLAAMTQEQRTAEYARIAKLRAEAKIQQEQFAAYTLRLDKEQPAWNAVNPVALPLPTYQENARAASVAGNFEALYLLMPMSVERWSKNTPLGKFRFKVVNGKRVYIPFSLADFDRMFVLFQRENKFGFSFFKEPGANCPQERWDRIKASYIQGQEKNAEQYPPSDWRHVYPIYPGRFICEKYERSLWVQVRVPVVIAVGAIAAVYLGPIVYDKIGSVLTGATGAADSATKTASLFSKIQKTGNTVLSFVNKARTIDAIIKGEIPPPPISILGSSFTDWAMIVAKRELVEQAKEAAAKAGMEYIQKKLTAAEEAKMRREIEALQRQLAGIVPENMPKQPSPAVPIVVQEKSAGLAIANKKVNDAVVTVMAIALPALILMS